MSKRQLLPGYETTIVDTTKHNANGGSIRKHVAEFRNPGSSDLIHEVVMQEFRDEENIIRYYYSIPNVRRPNNGSRFTMFPKDMIEAIRSGEGDAICSRDLFGPSFSVVRFLDRTFGEKYREKTLKGWETTKFGYAIALSISEVGIEIFGKNYTKADETEGTGLIPFELEEEAEVFRQEVIQECLTLAQKHCNWAKQIRPTLGDADAETIDTSWKSAMEVDKRDADSHKDFIIWEAFCAMKLNNDGEVDPEDGEEFDDGNCFFVCQVIL